ncbi:MULTISPECIES: acyl-CoA dehydrogenase family protein [Pseudonocardia]|uniref:Acyl-CoA dehydrogenase n=2 Tax=Pseudonocardia TaxID=1847 RepID=A0A1Y2N9Q5_PSEAH|nr:MULTISPECIES: acyl-CoA dehydrogenase family protein [Pseudonocardia]OSY44206.1 Acyl-CoA dehydrogenase [Pseudonocardia autotrophica]TDN74064.1 glutaryl-CoA dehydrogenase [Pseudonocardia autotrophica]BBG04822.1 acyl-CoA dehydrogenase [Pseudonocardia autotrophica]GEC23478.1 acyl-CoA dehydrogenase [Pseudonocardia saturnea]
MIDYYRVDADLPPRVQQLRDRVRAVVDAEVLPVINDYWDRAEFPFALVPRLAELGVAGYTARGPGCPELSPLEAGIVIRELARGDGSITTFMGVQSGLAMGTIALLGDDEQRTRWLPSMAALDTVGAFALTEPGHGSDSVRLETTARRDGEHWVLDGAKRWIGNAGFADVVVVWARDADDGRVGAFVVESDPQHGFPPGYSTELITGKIGKRAVWQPDVVLDGVRVPAANRLPGARSFHDASRVLATTRGGAAWESLGHAMAAFEIALEYTAGREQFGRPIAGFQLVQSTLAGMLAEVVTMQLWCVRMAELQERGEWTGPMASLAKLHHARRARQVCLDARDLLGGNGLLIENHVARHLTDMEVVHTYEGTDHIQSLIVGRDLTGLSAFS